jgi:hypothetical protein
MGDVLEGLDDNQKREVLRRLKTEYEPAAAQEGAAADVNAGNYDERKLPSLVKFSGSKVKGEATFRKWKFEVQELIDSGCPDAKIRRAIQKSLFGNAAEAFMSIPKDTLLNNILEKFDKLFMPSEDTEAVLSKFYLASQESSESISDYFIRLESLLTAPSLELSVEQRESMLRARFWKGLNKESVKSSLRHKYDNNATSVELLNAARNVAEEVGAVAQHQPSQISGNEISKLTAAIDKLTARVEKLEVKGHSSQGKISTSSGTTKRESFSSKSTRFRGRCHKCKKYGHKAADCRVQLNEKLSA